MRGGAAGAGEGGGLAAQAHQDLPFEQVVELLQPLRSLAQLPVFQVMFAWQNAPQGELALPGLELSAAGGEHAAAKFDLTLTLEEAGDEIAARLEYATALFERGDDRALARLLRAAAGGDGGGRAGPGG